ncbi:Peroxisomal acyl-coenzyme a oxidase [Globisporangium polare]
MLQSVSTPSSSNAGAKPAKSSAPVELKDLAPLMLKRERACGDLDVAQLTLLTNTLRGSAEANARRKELVQLIESHPVLSNKDMMFRNHKQMYDFGLKKSASLVKLLSDHDITDRVERKILRMALGETLPLELHEIMFIPALETQATDAQQRKWLQAARDHRILGSYAQTELGHGSNIQGIETTAFFDTASQEFIINSPTLTSRKWWPGGLGKTATHAVVYARLFLEDGKRDVGVQAFMVQLRSLETHEPLPGIEVGDIGPKVGVNAVDNGYAVFHNVRVPHDHMLMRFAQVLPDGSFVRPKSDKLVYLTMVQVRAYMVEGFSHMMGAATTIATRFSAARVQGRTSKKTPKSEFQVLDYQNQQHVLLPHLALSYAASFMGRATTAMHDSALAVIKNGDSSFELKLAELHGASSGLKAWLAEHVSNGIEACRRSCGGHGFTESSNLHYLFSDTVGTTTYEGTFDVLVQQHARYLLKALMLLQHADADAFGGKNTVSFLTRASEFEVEHGLHCEAQKPEDFDDLEMLVEAFEVRSARIILELARQMDESESNGNACMLQMTRASTAHSELMLLSAFVDGVSALPVGPAKSVVSTLCALFGAWLMVKNLSDFCESGFLSSRQASLIRQQLVRLLPKVRKNAVLLADAWDFSDFELNSTIGRYDGDIYRALVTRAADEPLNKTQVPESFEKYMKPLIRSGL